MREFCQHAFEAAGVSNWRKKIVVDKRFFRPAGVHTLRGDAGKARRKLRWKPKVGFEGLVRMMVEADLEAVGGR